MPKEFQPRQDREYTMTACFEVIPMLSDDCGCTCIAAVVAVGAETCQGIRALLGPEQAYYHTIDVGGTESALAAIVQGEDLCARLHGAAAANAIRPWPGGRHVR
ncbi:MAG: hypothetical protein AB7E32_17150 [Desulfovibrio sp.]